MEEDRTIIAPAPKLIHFVWAGGKSNMPERNKKVVMKWLLKNPDFTVYLWIDEKTCGAVERTIQLYTEEFSEVYEQLGEVEDYTKELLSLKLPLVFYELDTQEEFLPGKIIIKDIGRNNLRNEWVSYFIERCSPNYGCSSDLIRYPCLFLFGGAYFDTDVGPGPALLKILPIFNQEGSHRLLLDDFSQVTSDLTSQQLQTKFALENPKTKQIAGNDIFACTKHNPLMASFFSFSIARLETLAKNREGKFALCYGFRDIKYISIYTTGPKSIRDCISHFSPVSHHRSLRGGLDVVVELSKEKKSEKITVEIMSMRCSEAIPVCPLAPEHNWLRQREVRYELEELKTKIRNTLLFEHKYFKIVRVDDCIEELLKNSINFPLADRFDEDKAFKFILDCFPNDELFLPEILLQITGKFGISCRVFKKSLPSNSGDAREMVACMGRWGSSYGIFVHQTDIQENSGYINRLGQYFRGPINRGFPSSLTEIVSNIYASLDAFEVYCKPRLDFFSPTLEVEVKQQILEYLENYKRFVEHVIEVVPRALLAKLEGKSLLGLKERIGSVISSIGINEGKESFSTQSSNRKFF